MTSSGNYMPSFSYQAASRPASPTVEQSSSRGADRSWLACHNCRKRKTKCDGNMPCNHCVKVGKECVFEDRKKPDLSTKALTDKLAGLQAKYERLSAGHYSEGGSDSGHSSTSYTASGSPGWVSSSSGGSQAQMQFVDRNIPTEVRDDLLGIAFANLSLTGLELDTQQFIHTLRTQPAHLQPHPCIISVLMLLATYFASPTNPIPRGTPTPEFLLSRARHYLTASLSRVDRILDFIGASSLLVWWFFQQGRLLEGQYEISMTARLCIDCGLHQLDEGIVRGVLSHSSTASPPNPTGTPSLLNPPTDVWDLELRVNRFWHVFFIEKMASLMTGSPSAFDDFSPLNRISTIWPRPLGSYNRTWVQSDFASVDDLLGSVNRHTGTSLALGSPQTILCAQVQAMALLTRAIRFSSVPPRTPVEAQRLRNSILSIHAALSRFSSNLPSPHSTPSPPPTGQYSRGFQQQQQHYAFGTSSRSSGFFATTLVKTYVHATVIHLNIATELLSSATENQRPSSPEIAACYEKRVAAAKSAVLLASEMVREMNSWHGRPNAIENSKEGLSFMFGYLWNLTAKCITEYSTRVSSQLQHQRLPPSHQGPLISAIEAARQEMGTICEATRGLSIVFPVLALQAKTMEAMMK